MAPPLENFRAGSPAAGDASILLANYVYNGLRDFPGPQAGGSEALTAPPPGVSAGDWSRIANLLHGQGQALQFDTAQENAASGVVPDYILGADGKLRPNPHKTQPSADGKIHIQIDSSAGPQAAAQAARQLQVAAVQEKIAYWQKSHPNDSNVPDFLKGELFSAQQASLTQAVPPEQLMQAAAPAQPTPQESTQPTSSSPTDAGARGGGGGGGGVGAAGGAEAPSFANNYGFDGQGNWHATGNPSHDGYVNVPQYRDNTDPKACPIPAGEKVAAQNIYDYLTKEKGFTAIAASAILGNMMTESSLIPNNPNPKEGANGLCQWEGGRLQALHAFAAQHGGNVNDWKIQVDFMVTEMQSGAYLDHGDRARNRPMEPGKNIYEQINNAKSVKEATDMFDLSFEKSAGTSVARREGYAQSVFAEIGTKAARHGATV